MKINKFPISPQCRTSSNLIDIKKIAIVPAAVTATTTITTSVAVTTTATAVTITTNFTTHLIKFTNPI